MLCAALVGTWAGTAAPHARGAIARQAHTCDTNVDTGKWKYCTEATEYCFPTCCPNERTCSVGPRDPNRGCPKAVSCCDPCNPKGSRPTPDGGCGPGPVAASCNKTCGPDVTSAIDDALARVRSAFAGWSGLKRAHACANLVTLPGAAFSWDIVELGPGGRAQFSAQYRPDCSTCGHSVQVGNRCHYSGSVNYVVYGVMMRLCHDHYSRDESSFANWFSREEMLELIYMHKNQTGTQAANFQASNEWALAGYQSGSVSGPTPPAERSECKPCPKAYSGPGLTVNWFPFRIRP